MKQCGKLVIEILKFKISDFLLNSITCASNCDFIVVKHEFKNILAPLCRCCSFGVKITISIHMLWFFLPLVIYGLSTYSPHTACSPGGEKPNHMLIPWFSSILKALMTRHVLRLILPVCSTYLWFSQKFAKIQKYFYMGGNVHK